MSGIVFIRDLAVVMIVAGGAAWICQRLGLSVVVGYLVAGAIIGPHTPPFALVAEEDRVQTLAQVGLVFLVFSIGLNLSISRLRRLGFGLLVATALGALGVLLGCRMAGAAVGFSVTQSLFIAGTLMVSSSAIISKVLDELNLTHERPGQMALGVTVLEDVVAVAMLTILSSVIQFGGSAPAPLLPTLGRLAGFIVLAAVLSLLLMPRLLRRLSREAPSEIRTIVVTGLVLGLGWLAFQLGYSLALGAFVLGAIIGSTRYKADIEEVFEGVRHIFGAVFFVAVGMLVDFQLLGRVWHLAVLMALFALVLRPVACALGMIASGHGGRDSVQAAMALTPLGEFSFIIAQLGVDAGVLPPSFFPVAVGASLLTSLAAPALTRRSEVVAERVVLSESAALRRWGAMYHDWLARLWTRQSGSILWRLTGKRLIQVALSVLLVSTLILLAQPAFGRLREVWPDERVLPMGPAIAFWTVFGVVVLAPLIAIWRNVSALAMILSEWLTQDTRRERRYRPVLEFVLRLVGLVSLTVWLLILLPTGPTFLGVMVSVVLLLAVVTTAFWRRLVRFQSRLEIALMSEFQRASHSASASAWTAPLQAPAEDWELEIDEVTLPRDSALAGRNLGDLALRRRFGCSVVGIDRQGHALVNPGAETILYPRDKLLILGAAEQLQAVARVLGTVEAAPSGAGGFEELTMETVVVPAGSPLAGRTLLELDLIRTTGVQLGGIGRGGRRTLSPAGRERLEAGDDLLVLGSADQIARFRQRLEGAEPLGTEGPSGETPAST